MIDASAKWTVDRNRMASQSKNTPGHDMKLPARVLKTYFQGKLVHEMATDGSAN